MMRAAIARLGQACNGIGPGFTCTVPSVRPAAVHAATQRARAGRLAATCQGPAAPAADWPAHTDASDASDGHMAALAGRSAAHSWPWCTSAVKFWRTCSAPCRVARGRAVDCDVRWSERLLQRRNARHRRDGHGHSAMLCGNCVMLCTYYVT